MIVVAEGPTAAGKTTWCLRHFPHVTISEIPTSQEVEQALSLRQRNEVWIDGNCRRWERAVATEQSQGVAVCDTDPFKLYYTWCLWRLGKVTRAEWEQAAMASRVAFADGRLGIADLILVQLPPHGELVRRRERGRAETGRQRGRFEVHSQLGAPMREWYEATDRIEPGRIRWQLPDDGSLDPRPPRRDPRSGVELFDALLAELPN